MSTFIIVTLALLGILVMLGGAVMFMYFSGLAGGSVVGWVMQAHAGDETAAPEPSQQLRKAQAEASYWEAIARKYERAKP